MRTSTTLAALAGLASTAIAQGSEHTLQSKTGFSSTRIFAPFGVGGAMVTPLGASGPNNATTTWGAVVASIMIDNPETSFTLGPNTAVYTNTRFGAPATVNGATYANATTIDKCAYTPASGSTPMTAECLVTIQYVNPNVTTIAYATTTYPRPATETITMRGLTFQPLVTAWDGMVDVYIGTSADGKVSTYVPVVTSTEEGGKVVTKTQGAGMPQMTAMVKAVAVMAVGAAAMAV